MLGGLEKFEVEGRRLVDRPRNMWRNCIQEGLALMGLESIGQKTVSNGGES